MSDRSGVGLASLAVLETLETLTAGRPRAYVTSAEAVAGIEKRATVCRSRSWYKARKTRAVKLSGDSWVAGMTGSGPVNGVLLCGAVP